jgi:cyclic beta-1,2-glucan synthetase
MKIEGGKKLRLRPCIPESWPGFKLVYRLPDSAARYEIEVVNAAGATAAVVAVTVDGAAGAVEAGAAVIDLIDDGGVHQVRVEMGAR